MTYFNKFLFHTPYKHQKTFDFLMLLRERERDYWPGMGYLSLEEFDMLRLFIR